MYLLEPIFSNMLEATTAQMELHLKDLVDQHLTVREQEKKLEEKYKNLKSKNDRLEAEINRSGVDQIKSLTLLAQRHLAAKTKNDYTSTYAQPTHLSFWPQSVLEEGKPRSSR